jgi:hypothetical protein
MFTRQMSMRIIGFLKGDQSVVETQINQCPPETKETKGMDGRQKNFHRCSFVKTILYICRCSFVKAILYICRCSFVKAINAFADVLF